MSLYNSISKILFFPIYTLHVTKPKPLYCVVHIFVLRFANQKMFFPSFCLLQEISDNFLLLITFNISLFYMVHWVWRWLATYLHIPCMAGETVWPRRALYLCIVLFQGCLKIVICWSSWIFFFYYIACSWFICLVLALHVVILDLLQPSPMSVSSLDFNWASAATPQPFTLIRPPALGL